jgi:hypothetical protein
MISTFSRNKRGQCRTGDKLASVQTRVVPAFNAGFVYSDGGKVFVRGDFGVTTLEGGAGAGAAIGPDSSGFDGTGPTPGDTEAILMLGGINGGIPGGGPPGENCGMTPVGGRPIPGGAKPGGGTPGKPGGGGLSFIFKFNQRVVDV